MQPLKITEMFAFVAVDADGNEGVMAFMNPSGEWTPMVGADMERVASLKPIADRVTEVTGVTYTIKHFKLEGELDV